MAGKPRPLEVRRRTGRTPTTDSGGRPLPTPITIHSMAEGVPQPPDHLGLEGRSLWTECWDQAITWLSPKSDRRAVIEACEAVDDLTIARRRYAATTDPADARAVATMAKRMTDALTALGFNPTARGRLGYAEVKQASALEQLIATRAARK